MTKYLFRITRTTMNGTEESLLFAYEHNYIPGVLRAYSKHKNINYDPDITKIEYKGYVTILE